MATEHSLPSLENTPALTPEQFGAQQSRHLLHLAGGISHDLNNALTVIRGYAERTLRTTEAEDPHRQGAQETLSACARLSALSGHLLAFAPQKGSAAILTEAEAIFGTTVKLLTRFLGEDIHISSQQEPRLGQVLVRPGEIEQLLIGSAIAARQSLPKGGELRLKAVLSTGGEGDAAASHVLFGIEAPGICLEFRDAVVLQKLASSNKGHLCLGPGVELRLPIHAQTAPKLSPQSWSELPNGGETLLVVEDDPALLMMSSMALKQLGYHVLQAANPEEALHVAEQNAGRLIDLVLTDMVLPKMNGNDLAQCLLAIHPEARVLFTSGYPSGGMPGARLPADAQFLPKPFSLHELALAVRKAMDQ